MRLHPPKDPKSAMALADGGLESGGEGRTAVKGSKAGKRGKVAILILNYQHQRVPVRKSHRSFQTHLLSMACRAKLATIHHATVHASVIPWLEQIMREAIKEPLPPRPTTPPFHCPLPTAHCVKEGKVTHPMLHPMLGCQSVFRILQAYQKTK